MHASPTPTSATTVRSTPKLAMAVVTTIFFMWGFLTCLNDILIPHLKSVFTLNYTQAMLVQFTFFGAYFLMGLPAGRLVAHLGYKNGIVAGLAVAGVGALMFWPAAAAHSYPLFLGALFVLATGITILQVAANPYVALLGPEKTASSRLNLSQAFNSLGTAIAPVFGGLLILVADPKTPEQLAAMSQADAMSYRAAEAGAVQMPYLGLGIALFALAVFIFLFRLPAIAEASEQNEPRHYGIFEPLRHRHVLLGVLGLFFYVGAEVSIGSVLVNYLSMPEIGAMTEKAATGYVSAYWTGAMVGRFIGSALLVRIDAGKLLAVFAALATVLLLITLSTSGMTAVYAVVAIGLFNSIMFPTIFTLGMAKLGPLTNRASSLLIMAIVGGAVLPLLMGFLADHIGLHHAFVLPLVCYLYIAYYGISGSRVREPVPPATTTRS
ncbi:L-fucose:H+ symporter permease [Pseudoxanthomonas sp. JBR18]|uniref:L-fucose:H+ symporter permease n=1 Tax=Pseudoxanthomonas sp. JBR18 TaxID=2969308 RepID=UPI0023055398|nr:L-fucose:H+ symporter permease [Pseudoxanthomonas sp. JBR18]WCE05082.1 L-fucose:H+ symporter permease [Pseudoxanthomonas sp. JBR18]